SSGEIRQDDGLVGGGEEVRRLRHEVHATEDDGFGIGALARCGGELERVTHVVGVCEHFVPLVEMPEDDEPVAESSLGGTDATVELLRAGLAVEGGEGTL